jgi:histidinol-phosphatase (PHP family)
MEWKVSLHGGHSGEFCDHAEGTLRETLEAAVRFGYHTFGVSEHAPRVEPRFLYPEEVEQGWDVEKLKHDFENYAHTVFALAEEFANRLIVLRGFEGEIVPADRYIELMSGYKRQYGFDYMVGSVHFVSEIQIDGSKDRFENAMELHGGLEPLVIRYYETVAQMVQALKPEVVGHLDLVRKYGEFFGSVETLAVRRLVEQVLELVRENEVILDLNTAGYRKGLDTPYPASWVVQLAERMGVGFCFGDDSHTPEQVGAGVEESRRYLLENGVRHITVLTREAGEVVKKRVAL